jgi:hypothetical protein
LADPCFALAFHCVEARIRPALSQLTDEVWFGLLHASAPQGVLMTPDVAVSLVLRVRSAGWARRPADQRKAALRLFHARATDPVQRLRQLAPPDWASLDLPAFVATAHATRKAFEDAGGLCGRLAASTRERSGGLAALQLVNSPPASPSEISELFRFAREFKHVPGYRQLLSSL